MRARILRGTSRCEKLTGRDVERVVRAVDLLDEAYQLVDDAHRDLELLGEDPPTRAFRDRLRAALLRSRRDLFRLGGALAEFLREDRARCGRLDDGEKGR